MKKKLYKWIAFVLASMTVVTGCQSGNVSDSVRSSAPPVNMEPTDEFVIYRPPYTPDWLAAAIVQFRQIYRDVNVTIVDFSTQGTYEERLAQYRDRVTNELLVGEGPDVIFPEYLDINIHKAMEGNVFLDLIPFMEQDKNFNEEDFLTGVFDAGRFKGRQCIMPIRVTSPSFIARTPMLEEIGISQVESGDMVSFMRQLGKAAPLAKQLPGFKGMLDKTFYFDDFFTYGNLRLIDYENRQVCPDPELIRSFMEAYKLCYSWDYDDENGKLHSRSLTAATIYDYWMSTGIYFNHLTNEGNDFSGFAGIFKQADGGYTDFTVKDMQGRMAVAYASYAAVRANTKNALNAYRFIQLMLSPEIQAYRYKAGTSYQYDSEYLSIRKESLELKLKEPSRDGTMSYGDGLKAPALPVEEMTAHLEQLFDTDTSVLADSTAGIMAWEAMEPFFRDEKSYEACFEELKSRLRLYMDE